MYRGTTDTGVTKMTKKYGGIKLKVIAIVGFRVHEEHPVFYKKQKLSLSEQFDDVELLANLKSAIGMSDFISIRVVDTDA